MRKIVKEYCVACNTDTRLRLPRGNESRAGSCLGYWDGYTFTSRVFLKDAYADPAVVILADYMAQEGCDATHGGSYEYDLKDYDEKHHLNLVNGVHRRKTLLYHIGKNPSVAEVRMLDDTRLIIIYDTDYCQNYEEEE